jgi:N-acetylmuramoyl-L-alanine amidase
MKKCLLLLVFASLQLWGIDFTNFDVYQRLFTREEIESKIQTYLEKDVQIGKYYQLTDEIFYIGDLANQQIDYVLHLSNTRNQNKKYKIVQRELKGAKIAIDPGHFGGIFAELEERYIKIAAQEANTSMPIIIDEGTLTYLTAIELKSLLEAQGAAVFITRNFISQGAIDQDFFEWLRDNPQVWQRKDPLSRLFRNTYNREDLKQRAKKINAFHPDITVIIHYNGHLSTEEKEQQLCITQANYNLVFIPGAFCASELSLIEDRYEFLRLLLSDVIEESLKLSQCLVKQFTTQLKVPLITDNDKVSYIEKMCLKQADGIYSRNLALTRLVNSPLCYGETLIQNSKHEIYRLSTHDAKIGDIPCSNRIKEVAAAYFKGIKEYFENQY